MKRVMNDRYTTLTLFTYGDPITVSGLNAENLITLRFSVGAVTVCFQLEAVQEIYALAEKLNDYADEIATNGMEVVP